MISRTIDSMSQDAGSVVLTTLYCISYSSHTTFQLTRYLSFTDAHYVFTPATASTPAHSRFDRSSYLYLRNSPEEHSSLRLQIANAAGTPSQDVLSGSLASPFLSRISYSHKQPCLFTLTLDKQSPWTLPAYAPKGDTNQKYLYPLHSVGIYLWTEKDAATLLSHLTTHLPSILLDVRDAPPAQRVATEHQTAMSPVVQRLERTAIGASFPPVRAGSAISTASLPGPPAPAPALEGYNPAAPAAPEARVWREKTPPPPEEGQGQTQAQPRYSGIPTVGAGVGGFGPSQQTGSYFSGPPQQQQQARVPSTSSPGPPTQRAYSGSLPPPPPQSAPSFAGPPTSPPPQQQSFAHRQSSYGTGAPQTQYAHYPSHLQPHPQPLSTPSFGPTSTPSFGPSALASPGLPPSTPGFPHQQQPPTPSAPPIYTPPPPSHPNQQGTFGYSDYNYTSASTSQPGQAGDVHSQTYRPTESEGKAHAKHKVQGQEGRPGIEARVEKRVGGFLKKLDRMI